MFTKVAVATLLAAGISGPAEIQPPYKHLKWGMSKSKVTMPSSHKPLQDDDATSRGWSGRLLNDEIVTVCNFTPKTFKLWRVAIVAGNTSNYSDSRYRFNHYLNILTQKYGAPSSDYDYFKQPYSAGDGYEDTALSTGNYTRISFWLNNPVGSLSIEMKKQGWTTMSYESNEFAELNRQEVESLSSEVL